MSLTRREFDRRLDIECKWDLAKQILVQNRGCDRGTPDTGHSFAELRQMTFASYVGQEKAVIRVKAAVKASKTTGKPLSHCAFIGPAGMGKTSLASCVADGLGRPALMTVGSALSSMERVAELIDAVNGGIAFVDEAHDLARTDLPIVSGLLPLLEDFMLHTDAGSRPVVPFTMIFATTTFGLLDSAIRSRMGIPYELGDYTVEELAQIAQIHAAREMIPHLPEEVAIEVAKRCRGNPRTCGNLVKEAHNFCVADGRTDLTASDCKQAFAVLGIDDKGLTASDWKLLDLLRKKSCALSRCAGYLGMDRRTFEETVFPYLFKQGYVITSSKGLELTDEGIRIAT